MKLLKDKKFWIIVAVTTVIVAVVVYFARKKKTEFVSTPGTTSVPSQTVLPAREIFPLKYGSKGEEVKAVQKYVNAQKPFSSSTSALPDLVIDGIWGPKTQDAVKYKLNLTEIDYTYYTKIILGIR